MKLPSNTVKSPPLSSQQKIAAKQVVLLKVCSVQLSSVKIIYTTSWNTKKTRGPHEAYHLKPNWSYRKLREWLGGKQSLFAKTNLHVKVTKKKLNI